MRAAIALLVVLSVVTPGAAQQVEPVATIDSAKLGVSLERIQRELRLAAATEQSADAPLRLNFQVQVFGQAPRIELFRGFDLINGTVPNSSPSHREMVDFLTPAIYRTPGLPVSAFAGWAFQQLSNKSKKASCEAEIADYRAMLMQGMAVAAPRCTQ